MESIFDERRKMRILALLMYATAVVRTTLAFSGSFETARTEEINGVIRVSEGLVMIGLSRNSMSHI